MVSKILRLIIVLSFLFVSSVYADITTGLVLWYPFSSDSGTIVVDASGNGYNGIHMGVPVHVPGLSGTTALKLEGERDYVRIPYNVNLVMATHSTAMWVKLSDYRKGYNPLTSTGRAGTCDSNEVMITAGGAIRMSYCNTASTKVDVDNVGVGGSAVVGRWDHYVMVYDPTAGNVNLLLYQNGTLLGSRTISGGMRTDSNVGSLIAMGSQEDLQGPGSGTVYLRVFGGLVGDYRVYNRVLSSSDVTELYNVLKEDHSADTTPPTKPGKPVGTYVSPASISVTWDPSTDAVGVVGYIISRATSSGGTYNTLATVEGTTTYTDRCGTQTGTTYKTGWTLVSGTTYYYKVQAYDAAYNLSTLSDPSDGTSFTIPGGTYNLSVTIVGNTDSPAKTTTSLPTGISCQSGTCSYDFAQGATVYLQPYIATQGQGSSPPVFKGWRGYYNALGHQIIYMDGNKSVTAYYHTDPPADVTSGIIGGAISGGSIK